MAALEIRLLPFESLSGAENMADDDVLLLAAAERQVSSLRFYTWSKPTLSLGYFQRQALREADPKLAHVDWVRRPSGGAAILHHHELTYALALPAGLPWQSRDSWVCRFHDMVAAALRSFGAPTSRVACGEARKFGEFLCFLDQTPGDLVAGAAKVAGSAQRKLRGALLQHGSILLRQSPLTPSLPGIAELTGYSLSAEGLRSAVAAAFVAETKWPMKVAAWTEADILRRQNLSPRNMGQLAGINDVS